MITLSETAARRVKSQLEKRGRGLGVTIGVTTTGCSGLAYKLEYVDELPDTGEFMSFNSHGVIIFVSQNDLVYLDGLTMEWHRKGLQEGFEFNNPNERNRCGCGESFQV
jgi:iron-sulfur cluster assembly protein